MSDLSRESKRILDESSDFDALKADRDHWQSRCAELQAALAKMLAHYAPNLHIRGCLWQPSHGYACTCGADEARKLLEPAHMTSTRHE